MLRATLFFALLTTATVAQQYYPYSFIPYPPPQHQPSQHLPPTTYYIVQGPPSQPIYRTVESAEVNGTPAAAVSYSSQPSSPGGTIAIAGPPPPPPQTFGYPFSAGQTYIFASPYPFPPHGNTILQGPPYPFPSGIVQSPTLVAPPYEKKQRASTKRIVT